MHHFKFIVFFFFVIISSCGLREKRFDGKYISPPGYNLAEPEKLILPERLDELSGMTLAPNGHFWLIEDESSVIYEIAWPNNKIIRMSKFAKNMDVEDVLWTGNRLFALKSNGDLYEVIDVFDQDVSSIKHDFPYEGKRDLESVGHFDEEKLILFCKECKLDDDKNVSSAFWFNIKEGKYSEAKDFKLTEKKMRRLLQEQDEYKLTIKPSATALHPISGKLYVLSSVGKWLLIMDKFGDMESLYRLDPKIFKQAEGITFDDTGNMFISNEADGGNANILKFSYKPEMK
ncbi:SdiA-regulated domain-containing protein [Echinicola sp. 20G]|uniref:SdiA-regulated domain-containing protein n=1 Tax=Echinicola sp. 20G TaxID=2781961 RepID=UPI00190FEAF0|nr:SdiA-regulated domain-containing protein [Echinicola sp. 20G]